MDRRSQRTGYFETATKVSRREFLSETSATGAALISGGLLASTAACYTGKVTSKNEAMELPPRPDQGISSRPNVVVICTDDLGYGDTSCYGLPGAITPNLQDLSNSGVRFTAAYVAAPLCSPSRAGLLTGRCPQRFGFEFNAGPANRCEREGLGLPTSEYTMADMLKGAGYRTGAVGKWHLGSWPVYHPRQRCFDEFFGFLHDQSIYVDPSDRKDVHSITTSTQRWFPRTRGKHQSIYRGTKPVQEGEYLTDAFTREALGFIDRNANSDPFFLYLSYSAPHAPLQVTDHYYQRFPHVRSRRRRIYQAMVSAVDDGVGAVLRKLEQRGIADNTLVVFLSDNGCATTTRACSNEPLNGGKLFPFEGGVRVPMLWRLPGKLSPGTSYERPVSSMDIMPTVAALAGAALPSGTRLDGVDLAPHLAGKARRKPHESLCFRVGDNSAIRRGRHKLINLNGRRNLLFDLIGDQAERRDIAKERPDIVASLTEALRVWKSGLVAPRWSGQRTQPFSLQPLGLGEGSYHLWT